MRGISVLLVINTLPQYIGLFNFLNIVCTLTKIVLLLVCSELSMLLPATLMYSSFLDSIVLPCLNSVHGEETTAKTIYMKESWMKTENKIDTLVK